MKYYIMGACTMEEVTEKEAAEQEERNRQILAGDPHFWDQIKWIFAEDVLKDLEAGKKGA